jgi:hypothetical protein
MSALRPFGASAVSAAVSRTELAWQCLVMQHMLLIVYCLGKCEQVIDSFLVRHALLSLT